MSPPVPWSKRALPEVIDPAIDDEVCRFMVSWHRKEEQLGRISVIDFDLVGLDTLDVDVRQSRLDYVRWAETLLARIVDVGLDGSLEHRRLKANAFTLRALCGQNIMLEDYVEATMGFRPHVYPQTTIELLADKIDNQCRNLQVARDDLARGSFPEEQIGPDPSDIERAFRAGTRATTGSVRDTVPRYAGLQRVFRICRCRRLLELLD